MTENSHFSKDAAVAASQSKKERDYWLNKLSGNPGKTTFPYSGNTSKTRDINKRVIRTGTFEFSDEMSSRLMKLGNQSDYRLHIIMVTAVSLLLYKYTGNKDIIVGAPTYKQDVEGNLINTVLALRNQVENHLTVKEFLLQVAQTVFEANENQNYPIETLLYKLNLPVSENDFPLFSAAVLLENIHDKGYLGHIKLDMIFEFSRTDEHIKYAVEYDASLYDSDFLKDLINHFNNLLQQCVFDLNLQVSDLDILSPGEKHRLIVNFNSSRVDFSRDKTVGQLIEDQAKSRGDAVIVGFNREHLNFNLLNETANRLARILKNKGISRGWMVGILLDRSPLMMISILAVWKTQGAYVPIETDYPHRRIAAIMKDSDAGILITQTRHVGPGTPLEKPYREKIIYLDQNNNGQPALIEVGTHASINLDMEIDVNGLAYVIYTSGSTGKPKGVMVEHIGMMNHIQAKINDLQISRRSIIAQNASHTFDISVWQFFTAPVAGGKTVIYPHDIILEPELFIRALIKDQVTILEIVPSYLSVIIEALEEQVIDHLPVNLPLDFLAVTGESVNPQLVKRWFKNYPGIKMINAYGPTEASDDITHHIMDKAPGWERISIGKPIQNLNIYILDENMKLCPIGIKGEISVSGVGVGRGYLNNVPQTNQSFMADPFNKEKSVRLYKTGDLGCWLPDGTIDLFGRKDYQVKIRGFRIELAEIENQLNQYPGIKEAVVVDKEDEQKNKYLCAYLTTSGKLEISKIKTYLSERLPDYMTPQYFVELETFPLTNNGKIDRKALPYPDTTNDLGIPYITIKMLEEFKQKRSQTVEKFFHDTAFQTGKEKLEILEYSKQMGKNFYPLSHPQKMIYYTEKKYSGTTCQNVLYTVKYPGILSRELLEKAINQLLLKNEGLWMKIVEIEKDSSIIAAQYTADYHEYTLDYFDFSGEMGEISLHQWIDETNKKPIPLIDNELFYFAYIKFSQQESGYCMKLHHIVSDGWTAVLAVKEIDRDYQTLAARGTLDDHPNPPYTRFILDEQEYLKSSRVKEDIEFWHKKLLPLPGEINLSSKPDASLSILAGFYMPPIPVELQKKMHEYCRDHKTSIYKIILAALSIYISKVTSRDDFVIGTLNHGRVTEVDKMTVGLFIRFIPLRITINKDMNFRDFVDLLGSDINYVFKNHPGYPFDFLINELRQKTGVDPSFFYNINLIGHPVVDEENFKIKYHFPGYESTPLSIYIRLLNKDTNGMPGLELEWDYQVEQFSLEDIKRLHQGLIHILTGALDDPEKKTGELELLGGFIPPVESDSDIGIHREAREVEKYLKEYGYVSDAIVLEKKDKSGERYLSAFMVSGNGLSVAGLKHYLQGQLSHQLLPLVFARLEKMPLTSNGKIDRDLLGAMEIKKNKKEHDTPLNEVEKKLLEIWREVLGRQDVGIHDNFFMIGGDSIKTIQIASRMNRVGYKVEIKNFFQNPTISQLSPLIHKSQRIASQAAVTGIVPLTPVQEEFFQTYTSNNYHFNQAIMFYSEEGFEEQAIKTVFQGLQEHHDALRMTYKEENRKIIQVNRGLDVTLDLRVIDLRNENDADALEKKVNEIQSGINLSAGPLMKLGLFHMNDGDRLLVVIHHLVVDGISWRILLEDIDILFGQYNRGEELVLPEKTDSFKLWSEKLSEYANSDAFLKKSSYWAQLESNITGIKKDFETEDNCVKDTHRISFTLGEEETDLLLSKVNNAFKTEINDILLTALGLGVKKTFGQDRVLIALEGHGREEIIENIDISRTVGWFTSLYPVILDVSYADEPGRQVKEIKETLRKIPEKGTGYGILKYLTWEEHKKEMDFKLKPQISFNYLGQIDTDVQQISFLKIAGEPTGNMQSLTNQRKFEIEINGITSNKMLSMTLSYNEKHFKKVTMEAFMNHFQSELRHMITFCCSKENMEFTPSDFTYKGLSIEKVDRLMELYPGVEDIYTLTPLQEGILFHSLYDDSSYAYFVQVSYRLQGDLDIYLVEKSLNELFKRHDILRTAFFYKDLEQHVQVVLKDRTVGFYYEDISMTRDKKEKEAFIEDFKTKDKDRMFDLSKDALMRVAILRVDKSEYEFTWSFHHILMDGWCSGILITEFLEIYTGYLENRPYRLPSIKQFRSYIQWLDKQDKEASAAYWKNYLDDFGQQTPLLKKTIIKKGYRSETVSFVFNKEKTTRLNELSAAHHVTLNTLIQATWGILLGKYNGKNDVVFGAVVSGRPFELEGVESIIGLFINAIPVRVRFEGKMKFFQLLKKIQTGAIEAEKHHHCPLVDIQSGSLLKRNLFDHIMAFENYPLAKRIEGYGSEGKASNKPHFELTNVDIFEQSNYDFNVAVSVSDTININFLYNGHAYERNLVERIGSQLGLIMDQVIENYEIEIEEIELLSSQEKKSILEDFKNEYVEYPKDKNIREEENEEYTGDFGFN